MSGGQLRLLARKRNTAEDKQMTNQIRISSLFAKFSTAANAVEPKPLQLLQSYVAERKIDETVSEDDFVYTNIPRFPVGEDCPPMTTRDNNNKIVRMMSDDYGVGLPPMAGSAR
jgi:hypothetical protein